MVAFIALLISACHMFFLPLALLSLFSLALNSFQIRSISERKWTRFISAASGETVPEPQFLDRYHPFSVCLQASQDTLQDTPTFLINILWMLVPGVESTPKMSISTQEVSKCHARISTKYAGSASQRRHQKDYI